MILIEKEPIMKFIQDGLNNKHYGHVGVEIITEVEYAPEIGAVQVVRCYECKYRCTQTCPMYHTEICLDDLEGFDSYDTDRTDDNGFCHLGARMDGEEDA